MQNEQIAALLPRIAQSDEAALAEFYDATNREIYGIVLHVLGNVDDAAEVTLDVYHQVWRTARSFDSSRGSVVAWLVTIARTRALERLRTKPPEPLPPSTPMLEAAYFRGLTHSQLAELYGESVDSVKARLSSAIMAYRGGGGS